MLIRTLLSALLSQNLRILIVTYTAYVPYTICGKHVLGSSSGVLSSTAGDELGLPVVDQVLIDAHLVLFGEESVIEFEAVLFEHSVVAHALDVEERVLEAEELEGLAGGRHDGRCVGLVLE